MLRSGREDSRIAGGSFSPSVASVSRPVGMSQADFKTKELLRDLLREVGNTNNLLLVHRLCRNSGEREMNVKCLSMDPQLGLLQFLLKRC